MRNLAQIEKKEIKLESLLKDAESHPLMQQISAEKEAATLARRKEAGAKIESLTTERDKVLGDLQADLSTKEGKFNEAKKRMEVALTEFQKAKFALSQKLFFYESGINRQKEILLESYDARIDEAIEFFQKKLEFLRSEGRIGHNAMGATRDLFSWKKQTKAESNINAVHSALSYCMAAIKELEDMKLSPECDAAAIEKLKSAIPDINVYQEISGEKPMEKVNTDARSLLPSDSESDWKFKKLTEKAKQVLGR